MDTSMWLTLLLILISSFAILARIPESHGIPCVYEGTLKSDKDWFGFLANVTVMTTGRMTFEFSYPADKCCQNILFYLEDQVSILNARMNCWQKEALLRPEDDQILRLTPRFSWSGCHMAHPDGLPTYYCEGGRSFTSLAPGDKTTTWYIATSNCASLQGLELTYKLQIIGHIGECKSPYQIATTPEIPTPANVLADGETISTVVSSKNCVVEGELNTTDNWHGYIANASLLRGGGFRFRFTYPYTRQTQNVILYMEDDLRRIREEQTCWQKEGVIRTKPSPDHILDLSFRSAWNGCITKNQSQGVMLVCQGERHYNTPATFYFAVTNCRSRIGVYLKYRIEFFGYKGSPCSSSHLISHSIYHLFRTYPVNTCFSAVIFSLFHSMFILWR